MCATSSYLLPLYWTVLSFQKILLHSQFFFQIGCKGKNVFDVNDPGFNQATYNFSTVSHEAVYH